MSKIPKTYAWASPVACLAIALAAVGTAFAQQQSQRDQSDQTQQQSSDQQDEQNASQSDSQSDQQARERQQQERQRQQQARQREQQDQQRQQQANDRQQQGRDRDQQARDRGQSQWERERSQLRGESARQSRWDEDQEFSRDQRSSQRGLRISDQGGEQQAGLGVSVIGDNREGVIVSRVHRGSPAEDMGIRNRDRITHIDGQEIGSVRDFISQIRSMEPGDEVELEIIRSGDERTLRGELESREDALVLRGQQWGQEFGPPQRGEYYFQERESRQTSYDEDRGIAQRRSGQASSARIEQLERQIDQMSEDLDDLRVALRDIRRESVQSGQQGRQDRETTARYDEYQRTIESPRRSSDRWGDTNRFRQADRTRGVGRSGEYQSRPSQTRQLDGQSGQRGERSQDESGQRGQRSGQYESDERGDQSQFRDNSPGGEIGEERLRVQSDEAQRD